MGRRTEECRIGRGDAAVETPLVFEIRLGGWSDKT
jgi:hypothetical protein